MARIAGVNIPTQKRVEIALTYIFGIGRTSAKSICRRVDIPFERRVHELTDDEVGRVRDAIDQATEEFQTQPEEVSPESYCAQLIKDYVDPLYGKRV